jgi:hypothetical protein
LTFINQNKLEYKVEYPLTKGNEREGVLDKHTMRDAIDALIERGHVLEIVPEEDEFSPSPHKRYCVQEGQERDVYQWSLYTAHHDIGIVFGDHSKTEVLFEIKTTCQSGKAAKDRLIKNREWGGQLLFTHWLNYGLICMIEISSCNLLVYSHGGEFSPFVGSRIVAGIMQFIANGVMISPDAPGNIIGRGSVAVLNEVFLVNLLTAIQKTKNMLEFCMRFGNGMSLTHLMNFSYLQCTWDAANLMLQDLMGPAVDCAVDSNDRSYPICLNLVLLWKFGIPACGHPVHMRLEIVQAPDGCTQSSCCMPCMPL